MGIIHSVIDGQSVCFFANLILATKLTRYLSIVPIILAIPILSKGQEDAVITSDPTHHPVQCRHTE